MDARYELLLDQLADVANWETATADELTASDDEDCFDFINMTESYYPSRCVRLPEKK